MRTLELDYCIQEYCRTSVFGSVSLPKLYPDKMKELATTHNVRVQLKRLQVENIESADDTRFSYFTKKVWDAVYDFGGYTVLFVPSYFDFIRLKQFFKNKNAQVAMVSEHSERPSAMRHRAHYEQEAKPVIMVTERALVFEKLVLRFAKNLVFYGLPDSIDVLERLFELLPNKNFKAIMKTRLNQRGKEEDTERLRERLL